MTLEGCVVRFADTIAYLGRDFQDAIEIGLINPDLEVPERCREDIGTTKKHFRHNVMAISCPIY